MSSDEGMFPLGRCDCGHIMFTLERDEACPICWERDRQDCPLRAQPRQRITYRIEATDGHTT